MTQAVHGHAGGDAKRLRTLEEENQRLKRIVADQALNIQVLKDVGSTAFYGVRGANGVVLITTVKR